MVNGHVLARCLTALAVVVLATITGHREAAAWTEGPCATASGVTVVIDFQELGGGVHTRCAPGTVGSGFEALQKAGIDYQTTVRFSGFLCKIAGKPTNDPCVNASPATAYWSYWLAPRGGQWCFSNWGAGNRNPPEGTVEGWSFSLNRSASTSPPPRAAVPGHISGAPRSLPANDCDQRRTAPTVPPTTAPRPRPAPTPATPSAPSPGPSDAAPPPAAGDGAPASSGGEGTSARAGRGSLPEPEGSPGTTTAAPAVGEPGRDEVAGALEERAEGGEKAATVRASEGSSVEQSEAVDLSGDGEGPGSPAAVVVTVGVIALLATVTVAVRRRGSSR